MKPPIISLAYLSLAILLPSCKEQAVESDTSTSAELANPVESSTPDKRITTQPIAQELSKEKLYQLKGDQFEQVAYTKAADYYLLYYSASW